MTHSVKIVCPADWSHEATSSLLADLAKHLPAGDFGLYVETEFGDQSRTDVKQDQDRADINDPPTEGGPVQT